MKDLSHINISRLTKKLNDNEYLPWKACFDELVKAFGYGNVKYHAVPSPQSGYALSYSPDGQWASVHVVLSFRVDGEWHDFHITHPVLAGDAPISNPTSFDANTAVQRAFVRLAATTTGLGLHLWDTEENGPEKEEMVRMFSMASIKLNGPEKVFEILGCNRKEFEKFTPQLANIHLEKLREIVEGV
jgi:hypothetical protein